MYAGSDCSEVGWHHPPATYNRTHSRVKTVSTQRWHTLATQLTTTAPVGNDMLLRDRVCYRWIHILNYCENQDSYQMVKSKTQVDQFQLWVLSSASWQEALYYLLAGGQFCVAIRDVWMHNRCQRIIYTYKLLASLHPRISSNTIHILFVTTCISHIDYAP